MALCNERETLKARFNKTKLARLVRGNTKAIHDWLALDTLASRARVRETDAALERAALRDPEAAHLYAELTRVNLQLQTHRLALGINTNTKA